MRLPSFSRQTESEAVEAERPATSPTAATSRTTPVQPRREEADTAELRESDLPPAPPKADRTVAPPPPPPSTVARPVFPKEETKVEADTDAGTGTPPVVAGPKPRASLLATLGLILGVAGALLVLSGPLLGYGIGVAALGLLLSLGGIRATSKRHVAGKTDALIGMVLSLGAIVLGVLALTGSLSWLGTDVQPVNNLREWLDAQFVNRF